MSVLESKKRISRIIDTGLAIRDRVNENIEIFHPELPFLNKVAGVKFHETPIEVEVTVKYMPGTQLCLVATN